MKIKLIYKITNLVNNKIYIGQTNAPQDRWRDHRKHAREAEPAMLIHKTIKKYGAENFKFETIASIMPVADATEYCRIADEIEEAFILEYKSHISTGKGYNVSRGGPTGPKSDETKEKLSQATKKQIARKGHPALGKKRSAQFCQNWSGAQNPFFGKKHSYEVRKAISERCRKLTGEQVRAIRQDNRSLSTIAKDYKVCVSTIWRYKHVPDIQH